MKKRIARWLLGDMDTAVKLLHDRIRSEHQLRIQAQDEFAERLEHIDERLKSLQPATPTQPTQPTQRRQVNWRQFRDVAEGRLPGLRGAPQ